MTGGTTLVHQGVFAVLDDVGDIRGTSGRSPDGLFVRDARHLSMWRLRVDDADLEVLSPGLLIPEGARGRPPGYAVFREQAVGSGVLAERLRLVNHTSEPRTARVRYHAAADFADQFELRADDREYAKPGAHRSCEPTPTGVRFDYHRGSWHAATVLHTDPAPHGVTVVADGASLDWTPRVPAHGSAELTLTVALLPPHGPVADQPAHPAAVVAPRTVSAGIAADTGAFLEAARRPGALTGRPELARACEQGLADLADLRVPAAGPDGEPALVPGAGVPWFLTLFGRDSLLAAYFALPYQPAPAADTLRALAATQGEGHDAARLEEPGKIVHEVRHGELSHFGQVPYARYYGTVDATPLFLVLLHAYTEQTGDTALAERLEAHARAAAGWLFASGGLDEHGYLVYSPDPAGLANQCWKDSADAICFADGTPAAGPIAVCEAQGYAYDALRRTAHLAERVWGDRAYARDLDEAAASLRHRFLADFPSPDQDGFPALALDGDRQRADVLASNAGHLLWSGILDAREGAAVGRRLLEPDFFSGWGVRTLAAGQHPYHPLSYHRGSVWPHDNALIALGLARYGLREEHDRLTSGLVRAAARHGYRLPELLAGYGRDEHPEPAGYPHSCSPQAWSTTAPLALLTAASDPQWAA
ncbi:glycogen debranching enzyme [Lipingzhangella halophila]|uniref:Glycogen debranching enzyme n=1 Tax=Lipingzhangella halophila TaxID=1783352 RepID=A0A7W7RND8_9ACTN|nr:glycogen debranching N-terminal domain-containing protein [Lipingzhangella halophila]MBB4935210.1 glycogen debranching enzyme [Lipingzhangella halophila]